VLDNGKEVSRKEIVVNDPLVYRGVRFYQASFGRTGKLEKLLVSVTPADPKRETRDISMSMNQVIALDPDTKVQLVEFIPDYVAQDGHVYARSNDVVNPAAHLIVTSAKSEKAINVWFPEIPGVAENAASPYKFEPKDLKTELFTGLEVSHEPGQWAVWGGVILMAIGLTFVFYVIHVRIWVVPIVDAEGRTQLWVGGSANRNRDAFELTFKRFVEQIRKELQTEGAVEEVSAAPISRPSIAGR
jgi:cytochrome c biogenesis protein